MKRLLLALVTLSLVAPANAFARGDFDPTTEFEQHEWVPIHLGPLDLSITKAVAYLILGSIVAMVLGILFMRVRLRVDPDRRQTGRTTFVRLLFTISTSGARRTQDGGPRGCCSQT